MDKPAVSLCTVVALLLGGGATAADSTAGTAPVEVPDAIGSLMREVARFRAYPHFDRAYALLRDKRDHEALVELESGLKHEPGNASARLTMVDVLTRLGRRTQAFEQIDIALGRHAGHAGALRRRAVLLLDEGRAKEAAPDLRALLAHPAASAEDRSVAAALLARVSSHTRQDEGSAPRLVLEAPAWMELADSAKAHDAAGSWREAMADYRRAIGLTSDVDTRLNLLGAQAAIARRQNDLEALRDCLVQSAALAPRNLAVVRELVALAQRNKDPVELQKWMRTLSALSRTAGDLEYLANIHYASGRAADAADAYRQAIKRTRARAVQHRLYMALGHSLFGLEDHHGAVVAFQNAASLRATPEALQAASQAHYRNGDRPGAIDALRTLVRQHPGPSHRLRLAAMLGEDEQHAEAIAQAEAALQAAADAATRLQALRRLALLHARLDDTAALRAVLTEIARMAPEDQRALLALARACADMGDHGEAASHFERSARQRPSAEAYRGLIAARGRLQDAAGSVSAYRGLLSLPGLEPAEAARAQASLAELLMTQGQHADAARAYRAALDALPDVQGLSLTDLHLGLGYALAAQQRPLEALTQFELAYRAEPRSVVALQLARTHIALQHADEAIRYGEAALSDTTGLTTEQHRVLLAEMATLYGTAGRSQPAAALRARALALAPEPEAALSLARAQLADRQPQAAQRTLDAWPPGNWSAALTAKHLDLASQIQAQSGRHAEARTMLAKAQQLESQVDRRYRLALLDIRLGQTQAGLSTVDDLMRIQPQSHYRKLAAQALYDAGQFAAAAGLYGRAVADEPNRVDLLRSQAYALMRAGRNDDAAAAFRKAIDVVRRNGSKLSAAPAEPASTRTDVEQPEPALAALQDDDKAKEVELWRMRQEVRKLNKNFDFSLYESYRANTGSAAQAGAGAVSGSGVVPSQGGVEAAWRPPGIGLRDDRTLHVFGRVTWSHRLHSLSIDRDTAQGSIGARYKPISTQQLYVGAERLLKSGRATRTDWLLRASYGWTDGLGIDDPRATHWNYSSFYADIGRFTGQRLNASYLEARQGRSWKVGEQLLLSPLVVLAARHQHPDTDRTSYTEVGAGVSLRSFFNATEYEAPRSSAEIVVQYKHGLKGVGSGWSATAILAF